MFYFSLENFDMIVDQSDRYERAQMVETQIGEVSHTCDENLAAHNAAKARHSRRRKNTFRAGTRRQRMCKTWLVKPRNSLRDNYWKGHFQFDTAATDSKWLHGRHSNSRDKLAMSYKRRKELEAMDYQEQEDYIPDVEPKRQPWADWDAERDAELVWNDWQHLCRSIQSQCGLSDKEMEELSCTDILYLATRYNIGGGIRFWEKPEPNGWEIRSRDIWNPSPEEIDLCDGTVLVPVIKISSACKKAERALYEDPSDYSDYGYNDWD